MPHPHVDDEEARMVRLLAAGKISEATWDSLWAEWQDRRQTIRRALETMRQDNQIHIDNLEATLQIIANIGTLYNGLQRSDKKLLLRQVVERVVVNNDGTVILELRAPFGYLHDISERMRLSERDQTNKNTSQDASAGARSDAVPGIGQ